MPFCGNRDCQAYHMWFENGHVHLWKLNSHSMLCDADPHWREDRDTFVEEPIPEPVPDFREPVKSEPMGRKEYMKKYMRAKREKDKDAYNEYMREYRKRKKDERPNEE